MLAKLLIHTSREVIRNEVSRLLSSLGYVNPHPDLLYIDSDKLGVEEAKRIREHLSLKPFNSSGRVVVIEHAQGLNDIAQNALLRTLEELSESSILILGSDSKERLLPTLISRCEVIFLKNNGQVDNDNKYSATLEQLEGMNLSARFELVEKQKDRDQLLEAVLAYYAGQVRKDPKFYKIGADLLEADSWFRANGNPRAILEYLMLILPESRHD